MINIAVGIFIIIVIIVVSIGIGVFNEVIYWIVLLKFIILGKLKIMKIKIMVIWVINNKMGWVVLKLK